MKSSRKILIIVISLALLYPGHRILEHFARNRQHEWAAVQVKRCSALGEVLYHHHEKHRSYPVALHDLVSDGFLTESRYNELRFQPKPGAEPREWRYHPPGPSGHFPLFSGKPVTVWNCPISTYIIGGADGSAVAFGSEKLAFHQKHHLHGSQLNESSP